MEPDEIRIHRLPVGDLQTNCYIISRSNLNEALIIDPGAEGERIIRFLEERKVHPAAVFLTHAHFDHSGAVKPVIDRFHIPLYILDREADLLHAAFNRDMRRMMNLEEPPEADHRLSDGQQLDIAGLSLSILHTPGHTPGSMSLHLDGHLITGDTLFQGSVGRTDLPGGDWKQLQDSIRKLMEFPPETIIYPGHGDESTLDEEARWNPFL